MHFGLNENQVILRDSAREFFAGECPMAFVRRPYRWIRRLADEAAHGRTFAAAPNFAFELCAQRGLPPAGEPLDLSNVVTLLNGSEPVTLPSIEQFMEAFKPYEEPDDPYSIVGFTNESGGFFMGDQQDAPRSLSSGRGGLW